jgi:hypothetical protein
VPDVADVVEDDRMRTWVKATLGGVALIVVAAIVLGATAAYFIFHSMEKREAAEAEAVQAIDAVKGRFGARAPLIEIVDPRRADVRINRPADASQARVDTIHVINWKSETRELVRTEIPLWLMRFSSVNVLSQLGLAPEKFRLTVADVERYGPGVVIDYGSPGATRVLIWVD